MAERPTSNLGVCEFDSRPRHYENTIRRDISSAEERSGPNREVGGSSPSCPSPEPGYANLVKRLSRDGSACGFDSRPRHPKSRIGPARSAPLRRSLPEAARTCEHPGGGEYWRPTRADIGVRSRVGERSGGASIFPAKPPCRAPKHPRPASPRNPHPRPTPPSNPHPSIPTHKRGISSAEEHSVPNRVVGGSIPPCPI